MSFVAKLQRARDVLEQQGRLSVRGLGRELGLGGEELDELVEELVEVQQVARRDGKVLVWAGSSTAKPTAAEPISDTAPGRQPSPGAEPVEARKVVTIIFADLARSTALHERLDPEAVRRFMQTYYGAMRRTVEDYGGTVVKFLGDGVMAAFGVPRVAEDDAIRAVRAGVAMQHAFSELARSDASAMGDIGLRVGINTGEVVVSADNTDVVGDPVNVSARLQAEAHDGEVVIGEPTRRLVATLVTLAPLGSVALKGRAEAMKAYRVESLDRPVGTTATAFVGRDEELGRITTVFEAAVAKPAARLVVLLGSPGLGKSRLIDEFATRRGTLAIVLTAHCDAEGGATFAPLAEALRELLRAEDGRGAPLLGTEGEADNAVRAAIETVVPVDAPDRARIVAGITALLAGSPASPEETFFVVRRMLAGLASVKPVVLVIDDLQWAEPLLLDLVEHLVQWGAKVPLLILVGARPELRDTRSSLAISGGFVSDVVTLGGLDAGAAMRLAANVIGATDLPAAVAAKVLGTSEGNPLFVAELVRMLVQEGALRQEGERWTTGAGLADLEMPPTIHALLAARIERLHRDERSVLERAAVIGRHFSRSALAALLPTNVDNLDARLEALRRSELIEPDSGWFLGEPMLRFHHALIRDAAYRRLLKGTRAELHEQLANWIEGQVKDAARTPVASGGRAEHDETIGWHLEQAHQLLHEIGPLEEKGRVLGERAAQRLSAAGRRALARDDVPVAADLLGRAIGCLVPDDPGRADLALDWCEALLSAGDVGPAAKAIDELVRNSTTNNLTPNNPSRLSAWLTCFTGQLTVMTAPQELQATAEAVAEAAEEFAKLGDAAGEAKAHSVHAQALARLGRVGACEAALDKALAAARKAGDRRRANAVLAGAPLAALWGPSPVTRASGRCLDVVRVLRITQGAPAVEAVALSCQGVLEALRGRTDAARRMIASSRKMVEELGIAHRLFEADVFAGRIDLLEGDATAAERNLRNAYEGLRELGLGIDAARAGALLGRALLVDGKVGEAESLTHESEALAGDDLQAAIAWRGVRAEALARRGEHATAVRLASEAVEIAAATDALLDHADARLALAAALRAAGSSAEAEAEEQRAIELWEAKGAALLAERARRNRRTATSSPGEASIRPAPQTANATQREYRRVSTNTASATVAAVDSAFARRDLEAVGALASPTYSEVDHWTGAAWDREAWLTSCRRLMRSQDLQFRNLPLAILGESLMLSRRSLSAAGAAGTRFDVGAYESEAICLLETDQRGLVVREDIFGTDHLGEAIALLYNRHAELLPEGPERTRAAATARSLAAMTGALDYDGMGLAIAPDIEIADHRLLGTWSARGAGAVLQHVDSWLAVGEHHHGRENDVLALEPDGLLIKRTFSGTARESGGVFNGELLVLWQFGSDGRLILWELFDVGHEVEALARFDELAAARARGSVRCRVHPNAASAANARVESAFATGNIAALEAEFDVSLQVVGHPTGTAYGREEHLHSIRLLARSSDPVLHFEALATLGDALVLARRRVAASGTSSRGYDVGAYERVELVLSEVGSSGRTERIEIFAAERLGDAMVRLYERYAELLSEGAARERAAATARSMGTMLTAPAVVDRAATVMASDFESVDHRPLSTWSMRGGGVFLEHLRALREVANDIVIRVQEVLALEPNAVLVRRLHSGTERLGGGAYERPFLVLFATDSHGRLARAEWFDDDREAEALTRFEELTSNRPPLPRGDHRGVDATPDRSHPDPLLGQEADPFAAATAWFENTASRTDREFVRRFNTRDWAGIEGLAAPEFVFDERRRMLHNTCGRDVWLEQLRVMFDVPESRFTSTLRATRGERLALNLHCFAGEVAGGGGPLAMEDHFALHQVDREGRIVALVLFDLDAEDAAYAELDASYEAGEAATPSNNWLSVAGFVHAVERRDWEAVRAFCRDDFVEQDHRGLAVLGETKGADAWVDNFRTLVELAPDTIYRAHHVVEAERGYFVHGSWYGTREGGPYELQVNAVLELDDAGRIRRADMYDDAVADAAFARLAELEGPAAPQRFANAATATVGPVIAHMVAHDWPGFERLFAESFRMSDRRRVVQLELDRDEYLAFTREIADGCSIRARSDIVATRGEQLALTSSRFEFTDGDVGPSEVAFLLLTHVDERGRIDAYVRWDPEDLDAAYAELDARWQAGEAAEHPVASQWLADYLRFFAARDWTAMAALFAPDVLGENHRLVGWGTRRGPEGIVSTLQAQIELAPDTRERVDHVRTDPRALLFEYAWHGTHEGGAFENVWIVLVELDVDGRARRADVWEAEQLDQVLARFGERRSASTAPPSRLANAATRAVDRGTAALAARNWEAFAALMAPGFRHYDRTRIAQLESDGREWLAAFRQQVEMTSAPPTYRVLATRGERLALFEMLWRGAGDDVGPSEIDWRLIVEVNDRGEHVAIVVYDPDDLAAAYAELDARFEAGEGSLARLMKPTTVTAALQRAWAAFDTADFDAVRALCAPTFKWEDRRPLVGLSGDVELMIASARERLAMGARHERREIVGTLGDRIAIARVLWAGGPADGRFEVEFLVVHEVDETGLCTAMVFLDPDDAHAAQREAWRRWAAIEPVEERTARPSSLAPFPAREGGSPSASLPASGRDRGRGFPGPVEDPVPIPPNAATRALDRIARTRATGGLSTLRELVAEDFSYDDRSKRSLVRGGIEEWTRAVRFLSTETGGRIVARPVATAGDRLALHHARWHVGTGDARSEIENFRITEVDADGKLRALMLFDPEDHNVAKEELFERYAASGADGAPPDSIELLRAWNAHDLERMRGLLPADFYLDDRKRTGVGRQEGVDAYIASVAAMYELSHDLRSDTLYYAAIAPHGRVSVNRWSGTNPEGGEFDAVFVCLGLLRDSRPSGLEIFELEDLDKALARFEELRAERET